MARDTRHLFDHLVSRKESCWDDVRVADAAELGDERMRALMTLPVRMVEWDTSPMDKFLPETGHGSSAATEWLVQRLGEEEVQWFYVNTEGYTYARYAFRFEPRSVGRG